MTPQAPKTRLPAGWDHLLDEVQSRLDAALRQIATQTARLPAEAAEPPGAAREQELAALAERGAGLHDRVGRAEALVREADLTLEVAEHPLRQHVAGTGASRTRLAEWLGRAIG